MEPNPTLLAPQARTCSHLAEPCRKGARSPCPQELGEDYPFRWSQVPSTSLADPSCLEDEHVQAKRARVETIVRGMCLSPSLQSGSAPVGASPGCPGKARDRRRKQRLPTQQGPPTAPGSGRRRPGVRAELHLLQQQLERLQGQVLQAERGPGPRSVQQRGGCGPHVLPCQGPHKDLSGADGHGVSEDQHSPAQPGFLPSPVWASLEILRRELTRAVSQAVDSVLQEVLLDPPGPPARLGRSFQGLLEGHSEPSPPGVSACKDALPLAVLPGRVQPQIGVPLGNLPKTKPLDSPRYPIPPQMNLRRYQSAPANCPLTAPSHIQENQIASQLLGHGPNSHWGGGGPQDSPSQSHPSSETALRPWGAARLQPSLVSPARCPLPLASAPLERLPLLPSVKMEQSGRRAVLETLPFSSVHIQEGLNPGHLKKAKLMFFFTRYPSSSLLKAYFPDVQFSRCITSQMIKWFSNFREFYYIQMEKFARQAISDGITNPKVLVVPRDSELFRALNMHYNKGNDFEVPDCFLEITSLTLQEFFRAVSAGKDSDPSWKKPIYKIISKLDSDIPEIFKSSSYPQELFRS
ncbi:prospero homeobox protein 2 [Carlito syrichta]|uniref:Prospero homeobox protein 2 n=1 Tax=Carlito syrichta TaxID=1868482 RepID=A0A1U7TX11_CARSF|nr:prospero homeobox protein 2 [Carlito syrichta]